MDPLTLYAFPGACSQVTVCALEQAGSRYEIRWINLLAGDQLSDAYKQRVPTKKVPALVIGERLLLENAAILFYLHQRHPEAGLLPAADRPEDVAQQISALAFCSGTLHPITRSIVNPGRLTGGDPEPVREKGKETALTAFGHANRRIAEHGWWFGNWSIVDVYVNWAFRTALQGGLNAAPYPALDGLLGRLTSVPAFRRALEIETEGREVLEL